jgi:hypothetical protein
VFVFGVVEACPDLLDGFDVRFGIFDAILLHERLDELVFGWLVLVVRDEEDLVDVLRELELEVLLHGLLE